MHFIFHGLGLVDGSGKFGASSKDSIETVEVLEELPSSETLLGIYPSSRLPVPSTSVDSIAILSHMFIPRKPTIYSESISLFFPLPIIIPGILLVCL